ncbi:transposase domain-containing protein, partial [Pseudomonas savastanoi]|uniref:transposase domain-containing protein n=1 Tax=Pseudomonas savastanoi TaxID=29438 RepID=UPI001CB78976
FRTKPRGWTRATASDYPTTRCGHDPYAYMKDVLTRLPTHRASEIGQLLPHN